MALTDGTVVTDGMTSGWWIILLFIIMFAGGWNGGGNAPFVGGEIQSGFNQAALTSGLGDLQTTISTGFANAEVADNARQMASMQQLFGVQTQIANGTYATGTGIADLKYTVASENCADRAALSDGIRDVIAAGNANTQRILDLMCQNTIDAKNDRIADLERQLSLASFNASQVAQTAQIIANSNAQTVALENYLNPTPIPAYVVNRG